jgi:signal peptidase II
MTDHDGASGDPAPAHDDPGPAGLHPDGADDVEAPESESTTRRPSYLFFGVVASIALSKRVATSPTIVLLENHLNLTLAYNKGGAWGLLQDAPEALRRPFFFIVSLAAIAFIVSLFGRVSARQVALKWGLPLVLGGALGNLADRVIRSSVVDFIDYRADWIHVMNRVIAKLSPTWGITDHWPTFNVADVAICIGVGLMALDMFTSRRIPVGGGHSGDDEPDGDHESTSTHLHEPPTPAPSEPPSV